MDGRRRGARVAAIMIATGLGSALFQGGCAGTEPAAAEPTAVPPSASERPAPPLLAHAAGGWLEHARSPLVPFCHAVLIAPDVVVSAARCADDGWGELAFGVGAAGTPSIPVVAASRHPLASLDAAHALIALVLERPVADVEPAALIELAAIGDDGAPPCGLELPTYEVTARGERGARQIWTACALDEAEPDDGGTAVLVAMEGYPNCHGDSGAGAFAPGAHESVVGWVTTAGRLGPQHPEDPICVTSVGLATVAANREFLADAQARSRVLAVR